MPLMTTARAEVWYADYRRDPAALPTLWVHGAGGAHTHFPSELRRLPEANALALDLPGHGSSPPPGRASVAAYAADVVALLDALNVPRAVIGGHSMGGAIAQTVALDYPERAAGLILIGTGAKLGVHPDILEGVLTELQKVAALVVDWSWGAKADPALKSLGYKTLVGTPAQIIHDDYAACNGFDVRARLGEIRVPVLVVAGTADRMTPLKWGVYLREHLANARLVTLEDAGHMMALEQPAAVTAAVRGWLMGYFAPDAARGTPRDIPMDE